MKHLLTFNQLIEKQPWLTKGGLRSYLFFKETNGLDKSGAILRIGRKILIDHEKFFEWIESINNGGNSNAK